MWWSCDSDGVWPASGCRKISPIGWTNETPFWPSAVTSSVSAASPPVTQSTKDSFKDVFTEMFPIQYNPGLWGKKKKQQTESDGCYVQWFPENYEKILTVGKSSRQVVLPLKPPPPPPAVQAPPPPPKPPKVVQSSLDRANGHDDPPSAPSTRDFPALRCGLWVSFQPPPPPGNIGQKTPSNETPNSPSSVQQFSLLHCQ